MNSVKDFDTEFTSIPDYILKTTKRIWEERGIGRVREYYGHGNIVRTPMGLTRESIRLLRRLMGRCMHHNGALCAPMMDWTDFQK